MSVARALWANVKESPVFMRKINGWLTVFWVVMIPISYSMGWLNSVTYVSALSLWALVAGHWSTWQAARVEATQQKQIEEEQKEPLPDRVAEVLIEKTDVQPSAN